MAMTSDYLIERRKLGRRVSFWRWATSLILIAAIIGFGLVAAGGPEIEHRSAHIAKLKISGVITGDEETIKLIDEIGESNAKAVLVEIQSPGGTVTGSEALFDALRKLAAKKPTVALVDGMAASGGYIVALATDRIFARETSIVGSIGVLFQYPDIVGLLDRIGVKVESIKSSPLKAAPSPIESATAESRAAIAALVQENFDWFKRLVRERRGLDDAGLATVSDGRVFTGKQGVTLGLVDQLGAEDQARAWLEQEKHLPRALPVREWRHHGFAEKWGLSGLARAAGLDRVANFADLIAKSPETQMLDGVLVLWHPQLP
mgnify:CR=1 FL=1